MSKKKSSKSTKLRITRPKVEREDDEHEDEAELEVENDEGVEDEETPEEEPQDEPEPEEEPAEDEPPPPPKPLKPAAKKRGPAHGGNLEEWEIQLKDRLQFIADYQEVTLPQFANYSGLGDDTRRVIDSYMAQDLLERSWRQAAGRYRLSDKGAALLTELTARSGS